ncbi:phenylalanine--tRNA ligase subunit alpha [Nocardiopsis ansamitocini]|uniref:Phenylalanine--tRNA ligase alpha subunit n=1 Tax=Nocardiopsis ansamitocini TaxID=1670832 RepID=A0A9W6P643_9ACTN|nr:phenylalanine--tRNA ligase subunit alpha [Nocardiopsis ansamitocini]GLU48130.1 phenylalanine--tRNA ligase alpha subunit [Nocardiopsis ansamitocini]
MSAPNNSHDPVEAHALNPDEVARMRAEAMEAVAAANSLDQLKEVRIAHAGDRSPLALANREIGGLPPAAKADAGKRVGGARREISEAFKTRQAELEEERDARVLVEEAVDVTLSFDPIPRGARHPLTTVAERMTDIFVGMGFEVAEGPEVEAEWYNFDALNFLPDHPARSMQDTFFVEGPGGAHSGLVLRTHTSPVQVRALLDRDAPVYVVAPGKTFRTDELDATHSPVFHQLEGLVVDEGITLAHLRGAIQVFVERMFGEGLRTRMRPSYFPFTEPSAEVDMECFVCRGASVGDPDAPCRTCSSEGWIEIGGCGVMNPRVLTAAGVDTERYSGWAFGLGIERTLMFAHGVKDMHDMVEGDVRFTAAFGMEI